MKKAHTLLFGCEHLRETDTIILNFADSMYVSLKQTLFRFYVFNGYKYAIRFSFRQIIFQLFLKIFSIVLNINLFLGFYPPQHIPFQQKSQKIREGVEYSRLLTPWAINYLLSFAQNTGMFKQ